MPWILRTLFCRHDFRWVRNVHGDEIHHANGRRSYWVCAKCDRAQYRGPFGP